VKQIKVVAPQLREMFDKSRDKEKTQRAILEGVARLVY
jgi:hypothetical protein